MLRVLAVQGYRSLRDLVFELGDLTVITGANGVGKTSAYRVLRLLSAAAAGSVVAALAREGGVSSVLWAGPEAGGARQRERGLPVEGTTRQSPVRLQLGFAGDELSYALDVGFPVPSRTLFGFDPVVKRECIWHGPLARPAATLVDRFPTQVKVRDVDGDWQPPRGIRDTDSVLTELSDPRNAPEVLLLRDYVRAWRFYDTPRTDPLSPARARHVGTRTPVLSDDGADLAAALQTIVEIGDKAALAEAVDAAFPGSHIEITSSGGWFDLRLHQDGLLRPLAAAELSDGTLRYLLWVAALLSPRPPTLLVLNEPETSLHPSLLPPLANLVAQAATRTQVVVVSHSALFLDALTRASSTAAIRTSHVELYKATGETRVRGQGGLSGIAWRWPAR